MTTTNVPHAGRGVIEIAHSTLRWLEAVPYWLLALPLRVGVGMVFWNSGQAKIASWETALFMFEDEFKVPILPPEVAAYIATTIELTTPILLWIGLATRFSAAALLGMTAVIEIFVYPLAWPTHLQWAAMLFVLLCYGPGKVSLDWWVRRRVLGDA